MESGCNILLQQSAEGEPLAPGKNGGGNFMKLCGCQNKDQMGRRLFDDLQKCVEGGHGQHMHFVDDIHSAANFRRGVDGIIPQRANLINTIVGGGIDFQHVHAGSGVDGLAGGTVVAGVSVLQIQTVDGLCQNFGAGGLAGAAGTGEEIGMAQLTGTELGAESLCNCVLTDHIVEGLGTVFPVQRLIHTNTPFHSLSILLYTFGKRNQPACGMLDRKTTALSLERAVAAGEWGERKGETVKAFACFRKFFSPSGSSGHLPHQREARLG